MRRGVLIRGLCKRLGVSRLRLRLLRLRLRGSGVNVCAPAISVAGRHVGVTVGDVRHRRRRYAGVGIRVLGDARVDAERVDLGE